MSLHPASIRWQRTSQGFDYETYNRDHVWRFNGGIEIRASSAPEYKGDAALANPEEALVAAASSCHMLTFLAVAAKRGYIVETYTDDAVGVLEKDAEGKLSITRITLKPKVTFSGDKTPDATQLEKLHDAAHRNCFIANSIKSEVTVEAS